MNIPKDYATGTGDAILANRISYLFDLKRPFVTIETLSLAVLRKNDLRLRWEDVSKMSRFSTSLKKPFVISGPEFHQLDGNRL